MNWGGFAAGLSNGFNNGVSMGKTLRDVIRESRMQDLREQGMAEANAERTRMADASVTDATAAPTSGPSEATTPPEAPKTEQTPEAPKTEAPTAQQVSASSPTAAPDAATAKTALAGMDTPQEPAKVDPAKAEPETTAAVVQPSATQKVAAAGVPTAPEAPVEKAPEVKQKASGRFSVKGLDGQTFETREQALAAAEKLAPSAADLFIKNAIPKIAEGYLVNGEPEKAKAWQDYADSHTGKRMMKDWAAAFTAPDFDTAVSKFGTFYTDHIDDGVDFTGHKMKVNADGTKVAVVTLKNKATGKETEMELTRDKMLALAGQANPQKLFELEQSRTTAAEKAKLEARIKAQQRQADNADKMDLEGYKQDRIDAREEKRGSNKKTTDPTERRALIYSDLTKNDPTFARLPPDQQKAKVDKAMETIYGAGASQDGATSAGGAKAPEPVKYATTPMKRDKSLPVYKNNETGKRYHRVNGVMVPIED